MKYQFVPYLLISVITTFIIITLLVHTWRNRLIPGARYLLITLVLIIVWIVTQACEVAALDLNIKIFWANIQYIPIMLTPVTYFYFSIRFTRQDKWLHLKWLPFLLLIVPVVFNVLLWMDGSLELIRQNVYLNHNRPFPTVGKTYGPLFWVFAIYNFGLCVFVLGILANALREKKSLYREQVQFLFWGLMLPGSACVWHVSGFNPYNIDPTPIVFGISGLLLTYAILRYRLLEVVPIAWSQIIQDMNNGIIVLDNQGQVLDANPAAKKVFGLTSPNLIGIPIDQAIKNFSDLGIAYPSANSAVTEVVLENDGDIGHYEISYAQLYNSRQRSIGWLLQAYNITERKATEATIRHLALHDPLTGLPNRNCFHDLCDQEIDRARIRGGSLAVAYLDLDDFKLINDNYGHNAGDKFLCEVTDRLQLALRDSDMVSRLGGDEFAILLTSIGTDEKIAIVGKKIMNSLAEPVIIDGNPVQIKVSIGFSVYPRDGDTVDTLINKADKAMYAVKEATKNNYNIYK
ncbi:MAG: histidine kinase N-terminal 7TM domain-containing protein [Methylocystaceae bacterium]